MPSRELTEILALVPPDFADADADFRAVRAMMAPFHGHPVPAYVTVTEEELGGVRCAWYEDTRRPHRDRVVFHCHGGNACGPSRQRSDSGQDQPDHDFRGSKDALGRS